MFLRRKFKGMIMIYNAICHCKMTANASMGTVGHANNLSKIRQKLIIIIYIQIYI